MQEHQNGQPFAASHRLTSHSPESLSTKESQKLGETLQFHKCTSLFLRKQVSDFLAWSAPRLLNPMLSRNALFLFCPQASVWLHHPACSHVPRPCHDSALLKSTVLLLLPIRAATATCYIAFPYRPAFPPGSKITETTTDPDDLQTTDKVRFPTEEPVPTGYGPASGHPAEITIRR